MKITIIPALLFVVLGLSSCNTSSNNKTKTDSDGNSSNSENSGHEPGFNPVAPDGHTHNLVEVRSNVKPATCTENGSYSYEMKCSICHVVAYGGSDIIPALDHNYVEYDRTAATFESPVIIFERCSRCGDEHTREWGTPNRHNFDYSSRVYDDTYHWYPCIDDGYEDYVDQHERQEHIYPTSPTNYHEVTETEDGYYEFKCEFCDYVKRQITEPALNKRTYHYCGDPTAETTYDRFKHYYTWEDDNGVIHESTYTEGCDVSPENYIEPDYDQDGGYDYHCELCGHEEHYVLPRKEHHWMIIPGENQHFEQCTDEGYTDLTRNYEDHNFVVVEEHRSTDQSPQYIDYYNRFSCNSQDWNFEVCSVCNYSRQVDLHNYSETPSFNETQHWYQCTDEGYEHIFKDKSNHQGEHYSVDHHDATFDESSHDDYTYDCGYAYTIHSGSPLEHNYSESYQYDSSNHWHPCVDLGYEDLKDGIQTHSMSDWVKTKDPSRAVDGEEERHCLTCDFSETRPIDSFEKYSVKNMIFTLDSSTNSYSVSSSSTISGEVYIPATYNNLPVTKIDNNGFSGRAITKIEIPESITEIGELAFYNSKLLETIDISSGVTSIGRGAFENCTSLKTLVIPDSVSSIGKGAFNRCSNLESLTIPFIGQTETDYQFLGYMFGADNASTSKTYIPTSLKNLTIGNRCTTIPSRSCLGLTMLTSVTFGNNVKTIAQEAFASCTSLETINFGNQVETIGNSAFKDCTSLTSLDFPDSVASITNQAFYNCTNLVDVSFGKGVTLLDSSCFDNCSSIKSLTIPGTVSSIKTYAFSNCTSLESLTLENGIGSIGYKAFENCSSLLSVVIPDSVTSFGTAPFSGCTSLTSMTIPFVGGSPSSDRYFGYLFGATSYSENSSKVPSSLKTVVISDACTSIAQYAFMSCRYIESITISNNVAVIPYQSFYGCSSLKEIKFGEKVSTIENQAFYQPSTLESLVIPGSVTSIGEKAFCYCYDLKSLTIMSGVESIGSSAFTGCYALESLEIADTVTSIGASAFSGASSMKNLVVPSKVTSIGNSAFSGWSKLVSATLPIVGKEASGSTFFGSIFGATKYSENASKVPSTLKTVVISGETNQYVSGYAFDHCSSIESITLGNNITAIERYAFNACSSLTSISIPTTVTYVFGSSFLGCTSLTAIDYAGTKSQWNSIFKEQSDLIASVEVIHCSDGDILL